MGQRHQCHSPEPRNPDPCPMCHEVSGQWPSLSGLRWKASHTPASLGTLGKPSSQHFSTGTGQSCVPPASCPSPTREGVGGGWGDGKGSHRSPSPAPRSKFAVSPARYFLEIFPGTLQLLHAPSPPSMVPRKIDILGTEGLGGAEREGHPAV